jgi:hypothetical protein
MAAPPHHRLLHHGLLAAVVIEDEQRPDGRKEEEHHLHNAHRKRRLEHGARLVEIQACARVHNRAKRAQRDRRAGRIPAGAVGAGNEAQLVHAGDQRAEEAEIQERDEEGGAARAAEADQRVEAPEGRDGADDEEDQDVGGRQLAGRQEAVDEVCLESWSVPSPNPYALCNSGRLTNMPMIGIRKTISDRRVKMKNTSAIIVTITM